MVEVPRILNAATEHDDYAYRLEQRYVGAPLAMHTVLTQQTVTLEELNR